MNTHNIPDTMYEVQSICGDLLSPAVLSTTLDVPVPPSMTLAAFQTYAYVRDGSPARLVYVYQAAMAVTLSGSNGQYWLAIHKDTSTPVAGWTRAFGGHYMWQLNATRPADPPGGLVMAALTVAGGVITAVDTTVGSAPRGRVAYGGSSGTLAYAPLLTWDNTTGRLGVNTATPTTTLDVSGDTRLTGALTLTGAASLQSTVAVTGAATLGSTLQVNGTSTLTGAVSFGNPAQTRINLGLGTLATLNSPLPLANGGTAATDAAGARNNLGLGNLATVNSPLPIANGGTQASDAGNARINLGLGSMATQNSNAVSISGGGATLANGAITLLSVNGGVQAGYQFTVTGQSYFSSTVQVQGALNTAGAATLSGVVGIGAVNPGGYTLYVQGNQRIVTDLLVSGQAFKPGGGSWSDSSSRAIKGHIAPITGALALLLAQRGRVFEYTEPERRKLFPGPQYGFIYDEVTIPQWQVEGEALCARGAEALFIEALRELATRLAALEARA